MTDQLASTASLSCHDPKAPTAVGVVRFDFNPTTIQMVRQTSGNTTHPATRNSSAPSTPPGHGQSQGSKPVPPPPATPSLLQITLQRLVFYGLTTQMNCDRLLSWAQPPLTPFPQPVAGSKLPTLTFMWGPPIGGFVLEATMNRCTVRYTRFLPMGTPIRAEVDLVLQEQVSKLPFTNPSSGGIPGRRAHTMVAGENLQSLAVANYGAADAWRRIAEANDIDDPLRVAAGQGVYLPSAEEIISGAGQ
jgi:nucleoid-associated protein YgaU